MPVRSPKARWPSLIVVHVDGSACSIAVFVLVDEDQVLGHCGSLRRARTSDPPATPTNRLAANRQGRPMRPRGPPPTPGRSAPGSLGPMATDRRPPARGAAPGAGPGPCAAAGRSCSCWCWWRSWWPAPSPGVTPSARSHPPTGWRSTRRRSPPAPVSPSPRRRGTGTRRSSSMPATVASTPVRWAPRRRVRRSTRGPRPSRSSSTPPRCCGPTASGWWCRAPGTPRRAAHPGRPVRRCPQPPGGP